MDHSLRSDSGERYAKRRPEELISEYETIKDTLNHFDSFDNKQKI